MKQEEKTRLTKEKILQAGIQEFGRKGYRGGTVNAICGTGINKGLVYHNYKNKDELYLACVERSFKDMAEYIQAAMDGTEAGYSEARQRFFSTHEMEGRLFLEASVNPPAELKDEVRKLRKPLDDLNKKEFSKLLSGYRLRPGISEELAFCWSEAVVNGYHLMFHQSDGEDEDYIGKIRRHEEEGRKYLEMMLFGIVEGEE